MTITSGFLFGFHVILKFGSWLGVQKLGLEYIYSFIDFLNDGWIV